SPPSPGSRGGSSYTRRSSRSWPDRSACCAVARPDSPCCCCWPRQPLPYLAPMASLTGDTRIYPKHCGFEKLRSCQLPELQQDITARFIVKHIDAGSRTRDQMEQSARSGSRNIAEGSMFSATSKKLELNLTNVARASLVELKMDYAAFLRQRRLT